MSSSNQLLAINSEWYIRCYKGGLQLLPPEFLTSSEHQKNGEWNRVANLISAKVNFYIMDHYSGYQYLNETALVTNGFMSLQDAIGNTVIEKVYSPATAQWVINNNNQVFKKRQMLSFENEILYRTGETSYLVDYKFPWYSQNGLIQGIIGIAAIYGAKGIYSLATSIEEISKIGLLSSKQQNQNSLNSLINNQQICDVFLSKRECECVKFLIRGLTSKMIAKMLGLSYRTIEHYIDNIKIKLKVSSRSELICKIIEQVVR